MIYNFLFFDTETTGKAINFNASFKDTNNWPRLVQLAFQTYEYDTLAKKEKLLYEFECLIKPGENENDFVISDEATKVHGITKEQCIERGIPLQEGLIIFNNQLFRSTHIAAHNMAFDKMVLACEMYRLGLNSYRDRTSICTMKSTTDLLKIPNSNKYYGGYKWPSLAELYHHCFNDTFDGAHDALVDVKACAKSLFHLYKSDQLSVPTSKICATING